MTPARILLIAFGLAGLALPAAASAGSRPHVAVANPARLGTSTVGIRDRVLPARARVRVARNAYGRRWKVASGTTVRVLESPSYQPDAAALQSWADFFDGLLHGSELDKVTVYLVPLAEMVNECGPNADSCFDPGRDEIILIGETPPDGAPIEDVAAHEYGHHIAQFRKNTPWDAGDWGPKYWATSANVCQRVRQGTAYPGDEGREYARDPGEAWAETNRLLNGGVNQWPIIDNSFRPDAAALAAARKDILDPWRGNVVKTVSSAFHSGGTRAYTVPVAQRADGRVNVSVRSFGDLNVDLRLMDTNGQTLVRANRRGHTDSLSATSCGRSKLFLRVAAVTGSGSYRLRTSAP